MEARQKIVRDPLHGDIKVKNLFVNLLETPELQRLYNIKQLGFAHLVFPGAHHTRLEHSLGTYHIASQIAEILEIEKNEKDIISIAALLHDIGHGPFSHTLESLIWEKFGVDHVDLTEKLIRGEYTIFTADEQPFIRSSSVSDLLDAHEVEKEEVIKSIRGEKGKKTYLSQLLNSTIDVDQLDYLMRDAYYTGVAYGMIDVGRLLQTIAVFDDHLVIKRKGVSVVENILMARGLMYSSVYFHKTVRIAELMLSKALEIAPNLDPFDFFRLTDAEIMNKLEALGGFQQEIVTRLKYRELFKQAFMVSFSDVVNQEVEALKKLENVKVRREKERELEDVLDIPAGYLIIDIPRPELLRAEPRIARTDICVVDGDLVKTMDDFTPVAEAIRTRMTPDWLVMIITDEVYKPRISEKVKEVLLS